VPSVPWSKKAGFKLVPVEDVVRLTGLEPAELLRQTDTQQVTRIDESGKRTELVRIPVELLLVPPEEDEPGG
jgi:hypothetical protein